MKLTFIRLGSGFVSTMILALASVLLAPAPAQAQVLTFTDPWDRGEFREDISAIKVTHGPRNLFVRMKFFPRVGNVNVTEAWVDTRAGNPGPEFVLWRNDLYPRHLGIDRVDRWNSKGSKARRCARADVRIDEGDVLMKVSRSCLKIAGVAPKRVRVTVHAYDEEFVGRTEDWAPRERRFGARFVHST
jgi:hypothetical protein